MQLLEERIDELEEENEKLLNQVNALMQENELLKQGIICSAVPFEPVSFEPVHTAENLLDSVETESWSNSSVSTPEPFSDATIDVASFSDISNSNTHSSTPSPTFDSSNFFSFGLPSPLQLPARTLSLQSSIFVLLVGVLCIASVVMVVTPQNNTLALENNSLPPMNLAELPMTDYSTASSGASRRLLSNPIKPNDDTIATAINILKAAYLPRSTVTPLAINEKSSNILLAIRKDPKIAEFAMQLFTNYLSASWVPILKSYHIPMDDVTLCPYQSSPIINAMENGNSTMRLILPSQSGGLYEVLCNVTSIRQLTI